MTAMFKELFEQAADVAGRRFTSEAVARQSLESFQNTLHGTTPVQSVLKRVFGQATVREVGSETGEKTFKIFLRSQPASDSIVPVIRGLRSGNLDSVARALDIVPGSLGTSGFRKTYSRYARDVFPDVRLAEEIAAAERSLPSAVARSARNLRTETAQDLLQAMDGDRELKKLVTRLSEHIRNNGGTRFKYVSTFFTLSGVAGTVAAVALALHEQAKRSAGCWRVYLDPFTRELRSCKILAASCRNKDANEGSVCDRTPVSFHGDMCGGVAPTDECVHCTSTAEPGSNQHISTAQYLDPDDLYVCRPVASVGEMLGKVVADVPDLARDVAIDVAGTVSRVWDGVKYFLLAVIGMFFVVFSLYIFVKVKRDDVYQPHAERRPLRPPEREPETNVGEGIKSVKV